MKNLDLNVLLFELRRQNISPMKFKTNKEKILYTLLFIIQILWLTTISTSRFVAPDEGFYLLAAELVTQGSKPYLDFFYPQAPYQPYFIASWFQLFGASWLSARWFSAIIFALLGLLVFARLRKSCSWPAALVGLLLLNTSTLTLNWLLTIKNYGLPTLFLFASYYLLVFSPNRWRYFWSGLFLALAIGCRSYVAVLAPLCLLIIFFRNRQLFIPFLVGGIIGLTPMLALFCLDPGKFWFNNLGYHLLRSGLTPTKAIEQKLLILQGLLGLRPSMKFVSLQIPILLWISIFSLILMVIKRCRFDWSILFITALLIISLTPTPTLVQYFVILVPFLITITVLLIDQLRVIKYGPIIYGSAILVLGLAYSWRFSTDLYSFIERPSQVTSFRGSSLVPPHTIDQLDQLAKKIADNNPKNEELVAIWPGYIFNSQANFAPEIANNFGFNIARKLSPQEQDRFKIISLARLKQRVQSGVPLLVLNQSAAQKLISSKTLSKYYHKVFSDHDMIIYRFDPTKAITPIL